jgi:hypothetical protein|tara:strand:+ start:176 stop:715 length:540 start_codon:yes stop_codon:yes gene_type:complete
MKASEIVDKFKNVLLNTEVESDDEIKDSTDVEVNEEIALNEQKENSEVQEKVELEEEVEAGYGMDDKKRKRMEDEDGDDGMAKYATKEDLAKAMAEIKAMISKLSSEEAQDVPEELSSEENKEEVSEEKQELSAQEPVVEPLAHDPEVQVGTKRKVLFGQNRKLSTLDRVMETIVNKNK